MILLILFWGSVLLLVYTYILFPLMIFLRGFLWKRTYHSAEITPTASVIIAAYNEENSIQARIKNLLALDFPHDCLEIIVASDGSNDRTESIVQGYVDLGVRLLTLPRKGKNAALNAAVEAATGEILVFTDANSIYAADAIRELLKPFADASVGGVAGNQRYLSAKDSGSSSDGERGYWNFDRLLKQYQSFSGNVTSATGSIYAIRRSLFRPMPNGVVDDFMTSAGVITQGYRLVFASKALAYEHVAASKSVEFGRKIRITAQGLSAVLCLRELLNPFQYGYYALQLFSHKVLRRLMFIPLLLLMFTSPFLWNQSWLYKAATLSQICFYGLAILGFVLERTRMGRLKIFMIPFFFCMVYAASFLATLKILRRQRISTWETQRQESNRLNDSPKTSVSSPRRVI